MKIIGVRNIRLCARLQTGPALNLEHGASHSRPSNGKNCGAMTPTVSTHATSLYARPPEPAFRPLGFRKFDRRAQEMVRAEPRFRLETNQTLQCEAARDHNIRESATSAVTSI